MHGRQHYNFTLLRNCQRVKTILVGKGWWAREIKDTYQAQSTVTEGQQHDKLQLKWMQVHHNVYPSARLVGLCKKMGFRTKRPPRLLLASQKKMPVVEKEMTKFVIFLLEKNSLLRWISFLAPYGRIRIKSKQLFLTG